MEETQKKGCSHSVKAGNAQAPSLQMFRRKDILQHNFFRRKHLLFDISPGKKHTWLSVAGLIAPRHFESESGNHISESSAEKPALIEKLRAHNRAVSRLQDFATEEARHLFRGQITRS